MRKYIKVLEKHTIDCAHFRDISILSKNNGGQNDIWVTFSQVSPGSTNLSDEWLAGLFQRIIILKKRKIKI